MHITITFAIEASMAVKSIPQIKRFRRGDRLHVQAQHIWLILVAFVMSWQRTRKGRSTMTYGELAQAMGYPDRQAGITLARQLGLVGEYCKMNDIPPLNVIVVNQGTGEPGAGVVLRDGRSVRQEQSAVLKEDWFRFRVPTTGTFRKVLESF
jgi:hypothetical protein